MPERAAEERQEAAGSPEPAASVMREESPVGRRAGLPASAWVWAVVALGAAGGLLLLRSGRELEQARTLAAQGHRPEALELLDARLEQEPGEPRAMALAQQVAEAHLEALLAEGRRDEALTWLEAELERRPYLEPLRQRLPELEARGGAGAYGAQ